VGDREPGQVRKEAALSGPAHAQWGSLAGAKSPGTTSRQVFDDGCTSTLVMKPAGACGEWNVSPKSTLQKNSRKRRKLRTSRLIPAYDQTCMPVCGGGQRKKYRIAS